MMIRMIMIMIMIMIYDDMMTIIIATIIVFIIYLQESGWMKGVPRFSLARVRCFQAQLGKENSAACGGFSLGLSLVATASNASLGRPKTSDRYQTHFIGIHWKYPLLLTTRVLLQFCFPDELWTCAFWCILMHFVDLAPLDCAIVRCLSALRVKLSTLGFSLDGHEDQRTRPQTDPIPGARIASRLVIFVCFNPGWAAGFLMAAITPGTNTQIIQVSRVSDLWRKSFPSRFCPLNVLEADPSRSHKIFRWSTPMAVAGLEDELRKAGLERCLAAAVEWCERRGTSGNISGSVRASRDQRSWRATGGWDRKTWRKSAKRRFSTTLLKHCSWGPWNAGANLLWESVSGKMDGIWTEQHKLETCDEY